MSVKVVSSIVNRLWSRIYRLGFSICRFLLVLWLGICVEMAADRMPILPACLRSWTRVNFAGMLTVDTGRKKVVGRFCSPITTVSHVVRAAMPQVNRRHMRTMLKKVIICVVCFIQFVVRFTQQLKSCYVSLKQALLHCSSLNQTISSQK